MTRFYVKLYFYYITLQYTCDRLEQAKRKFLNIKTKPKTKQRTQKLPENYSNNHTNVMFLNLLTPLQTIPVLFRK